MDKGQNLKLTKFDVKGSRVTVDDDRLAKLVRTRKKDLIEAVSRNSKFQLDPREISVNRDGVVTIRNPEFAQQLKLLQDNETQGDVNVLCDLIDDLKDINVDVFCND